MRKLLAFLLLAATLSASSTLTGTFVRPMTSQAIANATLNLSLSQYGIIAGSYAVVPQQVSCYTTNNGGVVGIPDPILAPGYATSTVSGSLAGGTYFVQIAYIQGGLTSLVSPEIQVNLSAAGTITVNAPALQPASATGFAVYIGTTSGGETLQGTVSGTPGQWGNYQQSVPLSNGAAIPTQNTTSCTLTFNDSIIPTYTYYVASLSDSAGNVLPGFPQNWYLSGSSVNVANIIPLSFPPSVNFPQPVLQNPTSAATQSIGSSINLNGHLLSGSANVGPGNHDFFFSGAYTGTSILNRWTPNSAITVQRASVFAQTPGSGGATGTTITVSNGTTSGCVFSGLIAGASGSGTSNSPSGFCNFAAGFQITVTVTADDHSVFPSNSSWSIEYVAQ